MSSPPNKALTIALAQANPHLGNIDYNVDKLLTMRERAAALGADCVVTPEMYLSGYPVDDLVLRDDFMQDIAQALTKLADITKDGGPALIVGAPHKEPGSLYNSVFYNSVFVLDEGEIKAVRHKTVLPNYGVFDEKRQFNAGTFQGPVKIRGKMIGLAICQDIWTANVCKKLALAGAEMIIALNASPFEEGKLDQRLTPVIARIAETALPLIYVNMVGGQDELVFDGGSFAMNRGGKRACQMAQFTEGLSIVTARDREDGVGLTGQIMRPEGADEVLWRALTLSIRDYYEKNNFKGVVLGLSGGIDSAIVATLAVDALGPEKVRIIMMPSEYTSDSSHQYAEQLAGNLGLNLEVIPIEAGMKAFDSMLSAVFRGDLPDITEENIQPRLRGMILMALSNKFGNLVLSTGNKSEYAVGYSTLYGDMCGGFAPIKDVWKSRIFSLAKWRNRALPKGAMGGEGEIIPEQIIDRSPSAELRHGQLDTDSLPPYDILDPILIALTEEMADIKTIVARGYELEAVERACALLYRAEFKRFQAAPGPKVTPMSFGRDRRLPLTSGFLPHVLETI